MGECMKPRWRQWLSTLKDFILETLKLMAIALLLIACTGVLLGVRDNGLFEFVGYSTMFMAAICNHLRVLLAPRPIRLGDPLSVGATTHIILPYGILFIPEDPIKRDEVILLRLAFDRWGRWGSST